MLSLIVAIAQNGVIGLNNKMPWYISEDLKYFREVTKDKTIIMGRKTFDSLPGMLKGRKHMVITSDSDYKNPDVEIIRNPIETFEKFKNESDEKFIIGGASIYKLSFPYCDELYITRIYKDFEGDTFLDFDLKDFEEVYKSEIKKDEKSGVEFQFFKYKRK